MGSGAVGSVLSARLGSSGHQVVLVGPAEHVRAIAAGGLLVEGVGAGTFHPEAHEEIPRDLPLDAAVLATKTFDLAEAASLLGRARAPMPTLLVQNGLGVEATALRTLRESGWTRPQASVVRAVQSIPGTLLGPGRVRATGVGEIILPDPPSVPEAAGAVTTFVALFRGGTIPLRLTPELHREIWRKLLVNAAINPITALHGVINGQLLEPPLFEEAARLAEEARAVAVASGFRFTPEETTADLERVIRASATNRSSMLQDLDRGRPTEIEAISGELVRRGERLGLSLPATRAVLDGVRRRVAEAARGSQPL